MGTTQSKKRRKDVHKKKRGSILYSDSMLPPRSASMDVLHHPSLATATSTSSASTSCPLCPHCQFTASWSSDHTLSNSLCHRHAIQGQHVFGRGLDKDGFDSCPECLQTPATTTTTKMSSSSSSQSYNHKRKHHQLCEISNQDYDEVSTMSLNRKISGRQNCNLDCKSNNNNNDDNRTGGIVQSKSADFVDFNTKHDFMSLGQHSQTKENVNPIFCGGNSLSGTMKNHHLFETAKRQSTSSEKSTRPVNTNTCFSSLKNSSLSVVDDINSDKERKSNLSLLEDDEVVRSRWVRRKQMAQELRTLRMHLQHEEDIRQHNGLDSIQKTPVNYKPPSINNDDINIEERNIISESFTSITTGTTTEADDVSDNKQQTQVLESISTSKDPVSRNSTFKTTDSTTTNSTSDSTTSITLSPTRRSIRSKFSKLSNYRYLDNHPVMTRLQNEQNNRLELMERRMEEIRISAMQEAERRRFAEIFPAKDNDSETQKLLREARESLERMKEEKMKRALSTKDQQYHTQHHYQIQLRTRSAPPGSDWEIDSDNSQSQEDAGEIIPVIHVLSSSRETTPVINCDNRSQRMLTVPEKKNRNNRKSLWGQREWPDINLGKPLTWLWLPFMLFPLVLRMLLSLFLNSKATPSTTRNGNSVTNIRWSHVDGNRNLPRDKRKKSC